MKGLDIFRGNDSGKDREHLKEYFKKPVYSPRTLIFGALAFDFICLLIFLLDKVL